MMQSYRALLDVLLTRTHSFTGPSWLPSSPCSYKALHYCLPFLTYFHPHSRGYIPTHSSHPCSTPDPPSTSHVSIISHYHHTPLLALLPYLPKGWSLHFALSPLFPRSEVSHLFPRFFMHHLSILVFTPSHCTYMFLVSNLSSPTTLILLGPTLSSLLPLIQWHIYDSFTDASKPYSCWLLLPSTKTTLPTISSCSYLTPLFSLPFLILLMTLEGPMNSLTSLHY